MKHFKPLIYPLCLALLVVSAVIPPALRADEIMRLATQPEKSAELHFLKPGKPEAATVLPPPPIAGSPEQAADLDSVRAVYHSASEADKTAAYGEKKFTVFNFSQAVGPFFVAANLPKTAAFFKKVQSDAKLVTDQGKDFFRRPRPFTSDPSLSNGKLEKSFSYPSGHSTESMTLALVLVQVWPEKKEAILAHARQMGWQRVQIARHYPTDIYAGRVLAQAIVKQMNKREKFEKDVAEVRAEILAAQAASHN